MLPLPVAQRERKCPEAAAAAATLSTRGCVEGVTHMQSRCDDKDAEPSQQREREKRTWKMTAMIDTRLEHQPCMRAHEHATDHAKARVESPQVCHLQSL